MGYITTDSNGNEFCYYCRNWHNPQECVDKLTQIQKDSMKKSDTWQRIQTVGGLNDDELKVLRDLVTEIAESEREACAEIVKAARESIRAAEMSSRHHEARYTYITAMELAEKQIRARSKQD